MKQQAMSNKQRETSDEQQAMKQQAMSNKK